MFILIGRDRQVTEISRSVKIKCPHCTNVTPFILSEIKDCVKLFFFTVLTYNKRYFLGCVICEAGWDLDEGEKDEFFLINNSASASED